MLPPRALRSGRLGAQNDALISRRALNAKATKAVKRRFGAKTALDYLIDERLLMFTGAAEDWRTAPPPVRLSVRTSPEATGEIDE
jgi:hypothetical protein